MTTYSRRGCKIDPEHQAHRRIRSYVSYRLCWFYNPLTAYGLSRPMHYRLVWMRTPQESAAVELS